MLNPNFFILLASLFVVTSCGEVSNKSNNSKRDAGSAADTRTMDTGLSDGSAFDTSSDAGEESCRDVCIVLVEPGCELAPTQDRCETICEGGFSQKLRHCIINATSCAAADACIRN